MKRILIIEDNLNLAHGLRTNLEVEGFAVDIASDSSRGLELARSNDLGLIILDLMLPGRDGYKVLEAVRAEARSVPVLILSARGEEHDKVRAFKCGADDYVTKPFGLMELMARVHALFRRARPSASHQYVDTPVALRFGEIEIWPLSRQVLRGGEVVTLRPKEFDLLIALARRRGNVASRNELLREVWGYQDGVFSRTLDTHVADLRRKVERDPAAPEHILTVHRIGYRLQA
ncbi:MAG: response regulator transcription factor [Gemmatimonadota bacterium]